MSDDNIILDPWNDNNNLLTKGDVYDIFEKAGFTELKSDLIKPSRIKESPINFECKVNKIID